jgi:hypothetical protein
MSHTNRVLNIHFIRGKTKDVKKTVAEELPQIPAITERH